MPSRDKKYPLRNRLRHKSAESSSSSSESEDSREEKDSSTEYESCDSEEETEYTECDSSEEEPTDDGRSSLDNDSRVSDEKKRKFKTLLDMYFAEDREREREQEQERRASKHRKSEKSKSKSRHRKSEKRDKEKEKENKKEHSKSKHSRRRRRRSDTESEEEEEDDTIVLGSEDTFSDEEDGSKREYRTAPKKYDIITAIYGLDDGADDELDEYDEEEDEDEECNSSDEKTFMGDKYEKVETPIVSLTPPKLEEDEKGKEGGKSKGKEKGNHKNKNKKNKDKHRDNTDVKESIPTVDTVDAPYKNIDKEYLELVELKKNLTEQLKKHPKNKILLRSIEECQADIRKLVKDTRLNNTKEYRKLLQSSNTKANEIEYFKKKLSNSDQLTIMSDLKEINKHIFSEKPYRLMVLQSKIPPKYKAVAMQKLNMLREMDASDHEYFKIKNWVDTFMRIPFGVYRNLSITLDDGIEACHDFMSNAQNVLDKCVYGMNDAKLQIMQMIGQWIVNPNSMGTAIAIHGHAGTGKTTIVKDGISKILGRDFAFIALGGSGDSSFLEGHSYTYEGSTWGKIVQILIDSKCMNPVIYFDELDKVSDTPRGQEIIGILTHLTDTTQNTQFHDKYFSEIDFDLSKCLFIFSYNDENAVNPILRDRMYRIQTKGYDTKEKIKIARDYMLPKIREQVSFKEGDVIIPDDVLSYLITNSRFTNNESGVRNLKRCLEIIHTKLNLFRLMKPEIQLFEKDMNMRVQFPITVSRKEVDILIKHHEERLNPSLVGMYV
jgi:ATP-dependent Lon protease